MPSPELTTIRSTRNFSRNESVLLADKVEKTGAKAQPMKSLFRVSLGALQRGSLKEVDAFYRELETFSNGERKTSPHIYWLGDSHTAADFMTHRVRRRLARILGDGGPGFVRVGSDHYRHEQVQFWRSGQWAIEPAQPARRSRVFDGVFGYSGLRLIPKRGAEASVRWGDKDVRKSEPRWVTLQVRLQEQASLDVYFGQQRFQLNRQLLASLTNDIGLPKDNAPEPLLQQNSGIAKISSVRQVGPISWVRFALVHAARMRLHYGKGRPEVFGAFLEYMQAGAVLDTAGINGSRIATILAWEETQHIAQIRARKPDLVVLSYGTNEVFDQTPLSRYPGQYERVLARFRKAIPKLPCWLIGPTDAAKANGESRARVEAITQMQRKVAKNLHCAFSSPAELMGGSGSFKRWMQSSPRLASRDKVHLTIAGYHKLGDLLADQVLPPQDRP